MFRFPFIAALTATAALSAFGAASADQRIDFVTKAIQGDNSEMMLGRLAEQRAASPAVRRYGRILYEDHSKGRREAAAVARTLGVQPPDQPMDVAKDEYDKLKGMSGPAFDHEFVSYMIKDHQEDIGDFRKEAEQHHGPAAELARKTLPVLHKHLDIALKLQHG